MALRVVERFHHKIVRGVLTSVAARFPPWPPRVRLCDAWGILTIVIKQDSQGRYCLNDLHKAAGGEAKSRANYFLDRAEAKVLIKALDSEKAGIPAVAAKAGRYGGTFVVKELVYAYAMWISPQFHLKVIRAYDTLATQGVAVHESHAESFMDNPSTNKKATEWVALENDEGRLSR